MGNSVFSQMVLNVRERPLTSDINRAQSQLYRTVRELQKRLFSRQNGANGVGIPQSGFIGDAFQVYASSPADLNVNVRAGVGFFDNAGDSPVDIDGVTDSHVDDRSSYKPLVLDNPVTFAVTPDGANPRIDIIEVLYDRRLGDSESRDIFTAVAPFEYVATLVNKTLDWIQDGRTSINGAAKVNYKTGVAAGVPAAPATTAGYTKIAEVYVAAAAPSVSTLRDTRKILSPYGRAFMDLQLTVPAAVGACTINTLAATPGVRVHSVHLLVGVFQVFILAGGVATNVAVQVSGEPNTEADPIMTNALGSVGTLSAGEVTLITGAAAAPVAVTPFTGADRILVDAIVAKKSGVIAGPTKVNMHVTWDYT